MTSNFYFTATSWFPGNVRVKPHSKHSALPQKNKTKKLITFLPSFPLPDFQTFLLPWLGGVQWSIWGEKSHVKSNPFFTVSNSIFLRKLSEIKCGKSYSDWKEDSRENRISKILSFLLPFFCQIDRCETVAALISGIRVFFPKKVSLDWD